MRRWVVFILCCGVVASACGGEAPSPAADDGRLVVAVSFAPIEEIVARVGGVEVGVLALTAPGAAAHDAEPTAKLLEQLASVDAVVYLGADFQPSLTPVIASLPAEIERLDVISGLDVLTGTADEHGDGGDIDPHVWLDPRNMIAMTESVTDLLAGLSPGSADRLRANAAAFIAELTELDDAMAAGLRGCRSTTLVTSHRSFAYLARRYELTTLPLAGLSPDDEPSAGELEAVMSAVGAAQATTIFVEENLSDALVVALADEMGLAAATLETFETLTTAQREAGVDYLSAQRANLATLSAGLGCVG